MAKILGKNMPGPLPAAAGRRGMAYASSPVMAGFPAHQGFSCLGGDRSGPPGGPAHAAAGDPLKITWLS